MYPRNAASPERIAIGPVILIADGTPQSSGVTVTVRGQGGAEAESAGTIAYGATGVIVYYTPTQAETDFTSFTVTASKASCIPVCVTIVTSASATPGYAGVDWGVVANKTTSNALTGTTIAVTQKVDVDTIKTNPVVNAGTITFPTTATLASTTNITAGTIATVTNLTNAPTNGDLTATMKISVTTAATAATPTAAAVTGAVGSVTGLTAATVHSDLDDIQARIPAALTAGGNMKADALAISGSTTAADALEESTEAIAYGTVDGTGATTTAFLSSALTPDSVVNDQFNGRVLIFKTDTTTTALRGQATTISDYVHTSAEIGTFTVVALTTAPTTGDTFAIL